MKLLLINIYNGQVFRGIESWINQILKQMISKKIDVKLIQGGSHIPDFLKNSNHILVKEHYLEDLSGDLRLISKVKRRLGIYRSNVEIRKFYKEIEMEIVKFNPDILISVNDEMAILRKLIVRNKLNTKLLTVGHAGVPRDLKYSDAFIALSNRDYEISKKFGIKTFRSNNGVDLDFFNRARNNKKIENEINAFKKPIILCVSALTKYKRVHLAIRAFEKIDNATLIIIGDGVEEKNIKKTISKLPHEKKKNIHMKNNISFSDMPTYFSLADVFVHCADSSEAFGSVIIEALSMGIPVVVNNDEVRQDIVGDSGCLVNPEDTTELVNAINFSISIKNDPVEIIKRKKQSERFNWTNIVEEYLNIFSRIT